MPSTSYSAAGCQRASRPGTHQGGRLSPRRPGGREKRSEEEPTMSNKRPRGYDDLKALAAAERLPIQKLVAESPQADPFLAGQPAQIRDAQWFADLWERFGFGAGAHLRRVHYVLISQKTLIPKPDGEQYVNVLKDY